MSVRPKFLALALAGAALLSIPSMGSAQTVREIVVRPAPGVETHSETVSYADLNLDHEAGARALLARLSGAAKRVCGSPSGQLGDGSYSVCVRKAVDRAVADVDNPEVTSLHQKHG